MTRAEIRTLVRNNVGETTASFWTDAEINTKIDNALFRLVELLPDDVLIPLTTQATGNTSNGVAEYSLPADLVRVQEIRYNSIPCYILPVEKALRGAQLNVDLAGSATDPIAYIGRNNKFGIIPTPTSAIAYIVSYIKEPTALSTDNTSPDFYPRHHSLVANYATYFVLSKDRERVDDATKYITTIAEEIKAIGGKYLDVHKLQRELLGKEVAP